MPRKKTCDRCNLEVGGFKYLKKINGERICRKCYNKNRMIHREETIELDGAKDDLRMLRNKAMREYYRKRVGAIRKPGRPRSVSAPKIKGSKSKHKGPKSYSYLTLHEKQDLFRMLIDKGCNAEEAKGRIKDLIESQKEQRRSMKMKNKSESQIKIKQQELLEELWRS